MKKVNEEKDIYKGIYDFIKEWGPDMIATELSTIIHMANSLTKEEIIKRCVAIRNALWDLEDENASREQGKSEQSL